MTTKPKYAIGHSDENGVYPWEVVELATGKPVVRASSQEAAERCLTELETKGYIEVDL